MKRKLLSSILSISLLVAPADIAFGEEQINHLQENTVTEEEEAANSEEKQVYVPGVGYVKEEIVKRAADKCMADLPKYNSVLWHLGSILIPFMLTLCCCGYRGYNRPIKK